MTASVAAGPVLVRAAPTLSPRQTEALRAYAETGDQRAAAHRMGISYETFKNHTYVAYQILGVPSAVDAFRVLGWLTVPEAA